MPTKPFPSPCLTPKAHLLAPSVATPAASTRARSAVQILHRRPTREQGRSLEILGHAIEYLVDSQLYHAGPSSKNDAEASQILMRLSREVFAECSVVIPIGQRLRQRLFHLFAIDHAA